MGNRSPRLLVGLLWVLVLAACGGGGGGGGFTAQDAKPGGLWQGTVTVAGVGQQLLGLVSETKQFHFIQADGVQYFGTLTMSGTRVTSNFTGVPATGQTFADGSTQGTGTLTGTVQDRSTITFTAAFTTANNTVTNASVTLTYDHSYDADSALATVAGNYTAKDSPGADTLTIGSDGTLSYFEPSTQCKALGTVTLIDAAYNLYNIDFTFASCVAPYDVANGLHLTGLLTIDSSTTPVSILFPMHGMVNGIPLAALFRYQVA